MPNEMVETPRFIPTAENTYVISYPSHGSDYPYDFAAILAQSRRCEREGDVERACNLRYDGIKKLIDLIPDEDEIWLDWEDRGNQAVLELLKGSAIDHFLVGDFEMAAGLFEMELDMDPEDHLEATKPFGLLLCGFGRIRVVRRDRRRYQRQVSREGDSEAVERVSPDGPPARRAR